MNLDTMKVLVPYFRGNAFFPNDQNTMKDLPLREFSSARQREVGVEEEGGWFLH